MRRQRFTNVPTVFFNSTMVMTKAEVCSIVFLKDIFLGNDEEDAIVAPSAENNEFQFTQSVTESFQF